jgi:hypothetical protein
MDGCLENDMNAMERPKKGRIVSYNGMDGFGVIELVDGTRVRFTHEALHGLAATHFGQVHVRMIRTDARHGRRAFDVRRAD